MQFRYFVATLSLILILITTAAWATAQVVAVEPVTPTVLSGGNLGFRVEGLRAGRPVGTLVVQVNGQWVEAELKGPETTPLSRR